MSEMRAYYRAGHKEPLKWSRNSHEYSAEEIYTIRHEETTVAGMKKMVEERRGFEPSGTLKWVIILVVVVGSIAALIFLFPYLRAILGI